MYTDTPLEQRFEFTPKIVVVASLEEVGKGQSAVVWRLNGRVYSPSAHPLPGPFPTDIKSADAIRQFEAWAARVFANPNGTKP